MEEYFEKARVKVATYNLFGSCEEAKDLAETLISEKVNIAAIQGVTKKNCDVLFRTFKSNGYQYTRLDTLPALKDRKDFEVIFSNIPVLKKEFYLFSSLNKGVGRGLCKYLVQVGERTANPKLLWFVTTQFEPNGSGGGLRKAQITELNNEMSMAGTGMAGTGRTDTPHSEPTSVIFAGDTSIPKWQNSSLGVPEGWKDAWRERGTSKNECTFGDDRKDQIWWRSYGEEVDMECVEFGLVFDGSNAGNGIYAIFEL